VVWGVTRSDYDRKGSGRNPEAKVCYTAGESRPGYAILCLPRLNLLLPAADYVLTPAAILGFTSKAVLEHHSAPITFCAVELITTHSLRLPEARDNETYLGYCSGVGPYQTRSMHIPVSRDTLSRTVSPYACLLAFRTPDPCDRLSCSC